MSLTNSARRVVVSASAGWIVSTFLAILSFSTSFANAAELCRVAIFNGSGASPTCVKASFDVLDAAPDFEVETISADAIRAGELKRFDAVLFPGGGGTTQANAIGPEGWVELRAFLANGGGYLGTCAGAYMALVNLERENGRLINAELKEGNWERGEAILTIELTPEGKKILGDRDGAFEVSYQNGPVVQPAEYAELPEYKVLAYFRSEVAENDAPVGIQIDTPAILTGEYGKGRVAICSPHPELTPSLNEYVLKLTRHVAGK